MQLGGLWVKNFNATTAQESEHRALAKHTTIGNQKTFPFLPENGLTCQIHFILAVLAVLTGITVP